MTLAGRAASLVIAVSVAGCLAGSSRSTRVTVTTPQALVEVTAPAPGTFRIRLARAGGGVPLPSFAVDDAALARPQTLTVEDTGGAVIAHTGVAALRVDRDPLRFGLVDGAGATVAFGERDARLRYELAPVTRVYGLGDKVPGLDRRGRVFTMWNTDAYGWAVDGDPLYKSIPFALFVDERGSARGLFVDTPSAATVDVGKADAASFSYHAERAPALDVYLFAGPDPAAVIAAYTELTGRTPLPPRWALGYHQSRYSYATEAEARQVVARLRADAIPVDAMWLDIDYQSHNRPFTVDRQAFPDFAGMIAAFATAQVRTIVIVDPHIAAQPGDPSYDTGLAADAFIHAPDGAVYQAEVWPGQSVFPDFTLARVRGWWGSLYRPFVADGVAGFWNDMNEPAIFNTAKTMPDDTPHRLEDGRVADHVAVHNAYGLLNARATYEGVLALRPDVRPFVLTRAAYAGAQRWAASWTGDNLQTWDHLAITIPQLTSLGVSGYPLNGADVSGYAGPKGDGPCPDGDLVASWMELGALQPFFRNHSGKGSCRREPWVYGEALEARMRAAIERRYRLLPYLYTAFEESSRNGTPVMRPLWLNHPADMTVATVDDAYLLGRDLLVAPRLGPDAGAARTVILPAGTWWDVKAGASVTGGRVTVAGGAADSVGLYARAGAIIPEQPVMQSAGAPPSGALRLDVWPGADCAGSLYLDDGESFAYRRGELRRVSYTCATHPAGLDVTASSTGAYPTWWSATELVLHGAASAPRSVTLDGVAVASRYDTASHAITVTIEGPRSDFRVSATW